MVTKAALASALAAFALVSCTTALDTHTAVSPAAKFSEYQTFAVEPPTAEYPFEWSSRSSWGRGVIQQQVTRVLEAKGYAQPQGKSDLVVRILAGRRFSAPRPPTPPNAWLDEDESSDLVDGGYVIDLFDGATHEMVWHGAARADIDPPRLDEDHLRSSVTSLLATIPSRSGALP